MKRSMLVFAPIMLSVFVVAAGITDSAPHGIEQRVDCPGAVRFAVSPDGTRLAYVAPAKCVREKTSFLKGGLFGVLVGKHVMKYAVVVDGQAWPELDKVSRLVFSTDGMHLAYVGEEHRKQFVVQDGVRGKGYDAVIGTPMFSADGRHIAYIAAEEKKQFVVVDGAAGPSYDTIDSPQFRKHRVRDWSSNEYEEYEPQGTFFIPGGKRVAYTVTNQRRKFLVVDGQATPGHDAIKTYAFSSDGARLAYVAVDNKRQFVVLDGQPGPQCEMAESLTFSANGTHFAYVSSLNKRQAVVMDGLRGPDYDEAQMPVFSPDGTRLAYTARKGKKRLVVVDGLEGPECDLVTRAVFSPEGNRIAYVATVDKRQHVVIDGKRGPEYDMAGMPIFSPDGKQLVYLAARDKKQVMVSNASEGLEYDTVDTPVFSPDGQRIAYAAARKKQWMVVLDGVEGPTYDHIGLRITKMERVSSYQETLELQASYHMALQGGYYLPRLYSDTGALVVTGTGPRFQADGSLQYLATKEGGVYRVKYSDSRRP